HTHFLVHTHCLSLSHTHTHTHIHTQLQPDACIPTHTHTHTLSHTHTHLCPRALYGHSQAGSAMWECPSEAALFSCPGNPHNPPTHWQVSISTEDREREGGREREREGERERERERERGREQDRSHQRYSPLKEQ